MATFTKVYDYNNLVSEQFKNEQTGKKELKIKHPDKEALIYIRVFHKKYRHFPTGIYIKPEFWDPEEEVIKHGLRRADKLNLTLANYLKDLKDQYEEAIKEHGFWDLDRVQMRPEEPNLERHRYFDEFWEAWWYFNEIDFKDPDIDKEDLPSWSRIKRQKSSWKLFRKFLDSIKITALPFKSVDTELMEDYEQFLKGATYKKRGKWVRYKDSYKKDVITDLKQIYYQAIREKYIDRREDIFSVEYKCQFAGAKNTSARDLYPEEFRKLDQLKIHADQKKSLQPVLDATLVAAMTGLGPGDLLSLSRDWIVKSADRVQLVGARKKTNVPIELPITELFMGRPWEILRRYQNLEGRFWTFTEQHFNRKLKELAELAGIQNPHELSAYSLRHTFGFLLVEADLELPYIQRLMAHTKISTTLIYAKYRAPKVQQKVAGINWAAIMKGESIDQEVKRFEAWLNDVRQELLPHPHSLWSQRLSARAVISWVHQGRSVTLIVGDTPPQLCDTQGQVFQFYRYVDGETPKFVFIDHLGIQSTYSNLPASTSPEEIRALSMVFLQKQLRQNNAVPLQQATG